MKKITVTLFIIGLVVEILAFSLSYVEQFSRLQPFLYPKYFEAKNGLEILSKDRPLHSDDTGFSILSQIFFDIAKTQNSPELMKQISIQKIEYFKAAAISFGNSKTIGKIDLKYTLSNGQSLRLSLDSINQKVEDLKNKNIFLISTIIFIIGVIIQITGFIIEYSKK